MCVAPPLDLGPEERAGVDRRRSVASARGLGASIVRRAAQGLPNWLLAARWRVDRPLSARGRRCVLEAPLLGLEPDVSLPVPARTSEETVRSRVRGARARRAVTGPAGLGPMCGVDGYARRSEPPDGTWVGPRLLRRAEGVADRLRTGGDVQLRYPHGAALRLHLRRCRPVGSTASVARAPAARNRSLVTLPTGVGIAPLDQTYADGTFESNLVPPGGGSFRVGEVRAGPRGFQNGRPARYLYRGRASRFAEGYAQVGQGWGLTCALAVGPNERLDRALLLEDRGLGTPTAQIGRNDPLGGRTAVLSGPAPSRSAPRA